MKVIIEQDMEGCAGILDWSYSLHQSGQLPWATCVMTDEVNAAVEGALEAGASEVVVLEAHPFDRERLHPKAQVHSGTLFDAPRDAQALLFVGRHAMSGVVDGVLNHTGSDRSIHQVRANGRPVGELAIVAAWFGKWGTPTALVCGDEAACREARDFLGAVETVAVKKGFNCHEAISLSREEACRRIREGARRALGRLAEFKPFTISGKVRWEIDYRSAEVTDWICRLPNLQRIGAFTTRFDAEEYEAALRMYYAQGAMLYRYDAF